MTGEAGALNSQSVLRSMRISFFLGLFVGGVKRVETIHEGRKMLGLILCRLGCRNGGCIVSDGIGWKPRLVLTAGGCERFATEMVTLWLVLDYSARACNRVVVQSRRWELEMIHVLRFVVDVEPGRDGCYNGRKHQHCEPAMRLHLLDASIISFELVSCGLSGVVWERERVSVMRAFMLPRSKASGRTVLMSPLVCRTFSPLP